ncbi:hypothetical protein FRB94_006236 [Tulasnella sp. JGI-2019a]|nr:hypothetical protein FRB94_006236 [Tulasnella sp. JGI-2019a]KAG9016476.1 hypothetical protein FRB93_010725 [Tulasnella sp. JGI-2019a]
MLHIELSSLSSLPERIAYLKAFLDFTSDDADALHAAKPVIAPLIPSILDAVYVKLLSFDITAQSFATRNTGFEGEVPVKVQDLHPNHPQIAFRKTFLQKYLVTLVTADYGDEKSWEYFDKVSIMHTGQPGFAHRKNKPELRVEYMHMAALLGYVVDLVPGAVVEHPDLDDHTKSSVLRALNKVIWIQNDLFAWHYMPDPYNPKAAVAPSNANQWMTYGLVAIPIALALLFRSTR